MTKLLREPLENIMAELMEAHRQWATRPADERYESLDDLGRYLAKERKQSSERLHSIHEMSVVARKDDVLLKGPSGGVVNLTNWSFTQLCRRAGAPAYYLNGLPAPLATECLNLGIQKADNEPVKLLLNKNGTNNCRAVTSEGYKRLWDETILKQIRPALDLGWMVPPARPASKDQKSRPATAKDILPNQGDFGLSVKVGDQIAPAGIYRGDRDMFLFLVNPDRIITEGGSSLMRGMFVINSEVGDKSFQLWTFLLETVCGNHIVWGASELSQLRFIHRGSINEKFPSEMKMRLREYKDDGTCKEQNVISTAKNWVFGKNKEEVVEWIFRNQAFFNPKKKTASPFKLNKEDIQAGYDMAEQWEHTAHAAPNTCWGLIHGLTRFSQTETHADLRAKIDYAAGLMLEKAMSQAV